MRIVGIESLAPEAGEVHTIDVWYSQRRGAWMVERVDGEGGHVGISHTCMTREDAEDCVLEWLRAHGETHLLGSQPAERRKKLRRAA